MTDSQRKLLEQSCRSLGRIPRWQLPDRLLRILDEAKQKLASLEEPSNVIPFRRVSR